MRFLTFILCIAFTILAAPFADANGGVYAPRARVAFSAPACAPAAVYAAPALAVVSDYCAPAVFAAPVLIERQAFYAAPAFAPVYSQVFRARAFDYVPRAPLVQFNFGARQRVFQRDVVRERTVIRSRSFGY